MSEPPAPDPPLERPAARGVRTALWGIEELLYAVVGLLLLAAAVLIVVGTVTDMINAIQAHEGGVSIGVLVLDRVLLTLIVAELLHTLRLVALQGEIVVEPFLFVGLIAVVRRILIITAEVERQPPGGRGLTNLLLELGLLGFLALALAVAIYLVRRSSPQKPAQAEPGVDSQATLPA